VPGRDAYEVAAAWDAIVNAPRALARVEAERERHMAGRVREEAASRARLLAVLPAARFPGVMAHLAKP
jgi:pheromone shutdown protein TraB